MNNTPKVSVITPVYKAEPYIEKCVRSLFEQTLDDMEYIFIDDCTPDNSMQILNRVTKDYPARKEQIKIIHHDVNKGISTTRNTGLLNATGNFIIHCDSDDWVDPGLYERLYNKAIEHNSDIVICDYKTINHKTTKIKIDFFDENSKNCIKALLTGKLSPFLWNKLIKKEMYSDNQVFFPDGVNIREDFYALVKLFHYAKKISKISDSYYHYRIHDNSISRSIKMHDISSDFVQSRIKASLRAYQFLETTDEKMKYEKAIIVSKLTLKRLIVLNVIDLKKARLLFPETDSDIFSSNLPLHHKFFLWSLSTNIFIFVRVYKKYLSIRY